MDPIKSALDLAPLEDLMQALSTRFKILAMIGLRSPLAPNLEGESNRVVMLKADDRWQMIGLISQLLFEAHAITDRDSVSTDTDGRPIGDDENDDD